MPADSSPTRQDKETTVKLKVLTLNCWGVYIPVIVESKKSERIPAIGDKLAEGEFDIVLLQEIWNQADYRILCDKIQPALPYTHYYNSGVFGSGLCVFSKFPIIETLEYRYSLNGYAHKVYHGDWFGGKSVGLCKVLIGDIIVNVYNTHLHAEYNEARDEYLAHRVAQAFEMSQFVKHTSETCDIVIATGDFNLQPSSLGHKVIMSNGNFLDAWTSQKDKSKNKFDGMTCDRPDNPFTKHSSKKKHPKGKRLDYILYRNNADNDMECDRCYVTLQEMPSAKYHYSDHEGVAAEFTIKRNENSDGLQRDTAEVTRHLRYILPVMAIGERAVYSDRNNFLVSALFWFFVLVMTGFVASGWTLFSLPLVCLLVLRFGFFLWMIYSDRNKCLVSALFCFFVLMMTVFMASGWMPFSLPLVCLLVLRLGFFLWMGVVMINVELNCLIAARKNVKTLLPAQAAM